MKKQTLYIVTLCCFLWNMGWSQETNRLTTIQNKLDLLKLEVAGLEEKVNVNISNTSLSNFLLAVSQVHGININVTEELNAITIVNGFNDVTVQDLLIFLVKEYDLNIDFTGNILSIKKYQSPIKEPEIKEIITSFDVVSGKLTLDLNNDSLDAVFRKIMDISGRNLLFSPEVKSKSLSLYLKEVPFDIAMEKLAIANDLELSKTRDGFYTFDSFFEQGAKGATRASGSSTVRPKRRSSNFYYKILDSITKTVAVDFSKTSVADIVYTLTDELHIDVFTATPLENAGTATVKANQISFDELLVKIFESAKATSSSQESSNRGGRNNRRNDNEQNTLISNVSSFTFKKEGSIYYFGTEDQLSLKRIELVPMMHRSIELLGDASATGSSFNSGKNNFNAGGVNYIGSGQQGVSSQNSNGFNSRDRVGGFSNSERSNTSGSSGETSSMGAITALFPPTILQGLDIKIDTELNGFVVSGASTRVQKFKEFVKYIDKPVPVILIEVMIMEVSRSSTVDTGVEFGLGEEPATDKGVSFPDANITLGASTVNRVIGGFDGFGSLNLGKVVPNFYANIKAMESNGNLKILSTPKLSTLNGHKAYLSSGQTTYYAVTNQNFFGSQIPQTSQVTNYQPINAELALEFKPFVSGDGQITLDIQVVQSSFGQRTAEDAPPDINSRRFSSIIRMQDKDVAILGGIEEKMKNDSGSGVPLLARIPIIKWFFSKRKREDSKKKLNILVKPTVFY